MDYNHIVIIALSLIFSAIFSGLEVAFVSADKLQIELEGKRGKFGGRIVSRFLKKPSTFISATLLGHIIALVVYGIYMAIALQPVIASSLPDYLHTDAMIVTIQTFLAALIILVTAEFIPRSLFLGNPNRLLTFFAPVVIVFYYLMYPVIFVVVGLSRFILTKIMRLKNFEDHPLFGLTDLNNQLRNNLLDTPKNQTSDVNARIFTNALEFKTVKVRECMIPRTELEAVDIEDGIDELKEAFIRSGHSKILVYKDSIDDIIGYCHSLEIFKKPKEINSILNPIIIVPETMLANELMIQFITERKSIALVVDEFGGTSGVITMEDIIEEIFGDIQDEHDVEEWVEQKIGDKTFMLSARHEIDYLNERYGWELPLGDYDTLGGFILSITEDIPEINDVVEYGRFTFTIVSMQDARIDIVKLSIGDTNENN